MQLEKESEHVGGIYRKIILLGIFLHSSQVVIFFIFKCPLVACYNVVSVCFYVIMLKLVAHGRFRLAVGSIHAEVCTFVTVSTFLGGWDLGVPLYLLAMASLIYFCPWEHTIIPYLIAIGEVFVYIGVWFFSRTYPPVYHLSREFTTWYHLYSAVAGFSIILISAFLSNLSAAVTQKMLQEENKSLEKIANYDYLTSLMSRQFFLKELERYPDGMPVAMALGDIDNFKHINDTYGHVAGDYVLRSIAHIFLTNRSLSTLACRWGGEEFVFFFPDRSGAEVTKELEKIKAEVEHADFVFEKKKISVTMTLGVCFGQSGQNYQSMIERADELMYCGKQTGKNRILIGE